MHICILIGLLRDSTMKVGSVWTEDCAFASHPTQQVGGGGKRMGLILRAAYLNTSKQAQQRPHLNGNNPNNNNSEEMCENVWMCFIFSGRTRHH